MRNILVVALSLLPAVALADTSVTFEPPKLNLAVSSDGGVSGSRFLNVRVSRSGDLVEEETCRKISRIAVEVEGAEVASAKVGKNGGLCWFMSSDVPLRGELITEKEAREACTSEEQTVALKKEVEVIFSGPADKGGRASSWTEHSADVEITLACGSKCAPPVIGAEELPLAFAGKSYNTTLSASGYGPLTFTHTEGTLPPGVLLSPNGQISGNPAAAGTYSFTVQVKDSCPSKPATARKRLTLQVEKPCAPLSLGGDKALPDATVGRRYSFPVPLSGPGKGVTFSIASGALPEGLVLSEDGVISGKPVAPGIRSFTIRASDFCGTDRRFSERSYSVTVFETPEGTKLDPPPRAEKPQKPVAEFEKPLRKELDAVEKVRRGRDELSATLLKFDEDMEGYRKALLDYNVRLGSCQATRYTDKDRRAAGCAQLDPPGECMEKLMTRCLEDFPAKVEDAKRKVKDDAAGIRGAAINIEGIAGRLP